MIAKVIAKDELLRIIQEKPPVYRLAESGGFQGNYYTATENGQVKLESSWDNVRKNTQTALEKWKDHAYGVLKAIINKGSRSAYLDLVDAIEKILGYEFVPSYLLPRLGPPSSLCSRPAATSILTGRCRQRLSSGSRRTIKIRKHPESRSTEEGCYGKRC